MVTQVLTSLFTSVAAAVRENIDIRSSIRVRLTGLTAL